MQLSPEQTRGVHAKGHCVIIACPGSGKTRVLVQRAERILLEQPEARVGCVTFTRDAAREIGDRLGAALGKDASARVTVGTFHALAIQQLQRSGREVSIMGEGELRILFRRAWEDAGVDRKVLPLQEAIKAIEYAKATRLPPPAGTPQAKVLERYQRMLKDARSMDFFDVLTEVVDGMALRHAVSPVPVTHLLVDEFQDADQVQLAWAIGHARAGIEVTVVGDDDQSIYGFRMALGYNGLTSFRDATQAELITLATSYRCAPEILSSAATLIKHNTRRAAKKIRANAPRGGMIVRRDYSGAEDEALAAGAYLATRLAGQTCAILSRTKAGLRDVALHFKGAEPPIPFVMPGGGSIWNAGVPAMIRNLLQVALGQGGKTLSLVLMACNVSWAVTMAARESTEGHARPLEAVQDRAWLPVKEMSVKDKDRWEGLRDRFAAFSAVAVRNADPDVVIDAAIAFYDPYLANDKRRKLAQAAGRILKSRRGSLRERLANLDRKDKEPDDEVDGADIPPIVLMTLHGSKGLEWDMVWMIGLNEFTLPHRDGEVEEERRLAYVGMTRAKRALVMSASVEDGHASRFLAEAGLGLDEVLALA